VDDLTEAVNSIDLPALVADYYPDSRARPGTADTVYATWRGNKNTPSFSIYRNDGVWLYSDKATGETGNAFTFLRDIVGMDGEAAGRLLKERAGVMPRPDTGNHAPRPKPKPKSVEKVPLTKEDQAKVVSMADTRGDVPAALEGRGFTEEDMVVLQISGADGDALIPIYSPEGELLNVKRRYHKPKPKSPKYRYVFNGHGSPPWVSPNLTHANSILICEGELNGMIAWRAAFDAGWKLAVMGVAGAEAGIYLEPLEDKHVFIYADGDAPGDKAAHRWAEQAQAAGAKTVRILTPLDEGDFCDLAGQDREAFTLDLKERLAKGEVVYSDDQRRIAAFTIGEVRELARRRIAGEIPFPTGFRELDLYTGGMPEADLTLIGALPGTGKSALLRQVLLHNLSIRRSAKVLLFSPDQSAASIYRMIATYETGVSMRELQTGHLQRHNLSRYGGYDEAKKAWWEALDDALLHLSKRFIISEKQDYDEVQQEIWQQVEAGVTIVAIDYIQLFDYVDRSGRSDDRKMIQSLKGMSTTQLKVPIIAAAQLAKSKYGPTRKVGYPVVDDLEGTGRYHQLANQVYLIYNQDHYLRLNNMEPADYAAYSEQDREKARVYVAKNKEGESGRYRYLRWHADIVTFRGMDDPLRL